MASEDKKQGAPAPGGEASPNPNGNATSTPPASDSGGERGSSYEYPDDQYGNSGETAVAPANPPAPATPAAAAPPPPPGKPPEPDGEDDDEDGMLRMSFMEHLEELRARILHALMGVGIAFGLSLYFANDLWRLVSEPAIRALKAIGADPNLAQITPMDAFTTIWVKVPMLAAIFLASPWILYQVWAFIAPGLYKRERRWAGPFVVCTAGLFIMGGLFAYFVAFRFGLQFLLSIGRDINVKPVVSLTEYFDLFVNVMLGVGLIFEMPVLIFFLTLLRIVTPSFLIRNSRYAILVITVIAAIVTPTPDVFNLMLFTMPMVALYFVGIFAGYLLILHRENRRFPWARLFGVLAVILAAAAGVLWLLVTRYGYKFLNHWPYLTR